MGKSPLPITSSLSPPPSLGPVFGHFGIYHQGGVHPLGPPPPTRLGEVPSLWDVGSNMGVLPPLLGVRMRWQGDTTHTLFGRGLKTANMQLQ